MSNFDLKDEFDSQKVNFKFDFYPTLINPVSWKKGVDKLPEFGVDCHFHHFEITEIKRSMRVLSGSEVA